LRRDLPPRGRGSRRSYKRIATSRSPC